MFSWRMIANDLFGEHTNNECTTPVKVVVYGRKGTKSQGE